MNENPETLSFRAWLGRLFTPRRSFAYRELERRLQQQQEEFGKRYEEQRKDLADARGLVSKMYNYILIYQAHLPPVERPEPKSQPVESAGEPMRFRPVGARPRPSELHNKYRKKMREENEKDTGARTVSHQRERVAEVVVGVPLADEEQLALEHSIDNAAAYIASKAS